MATTKTTTIMLLLAWLLVYSGVVASASQVDVAGDDGVLESESFCSELMASVEDEEDWIANELRYTGGQIVDPHLHTAPWFDNADKLVEELESANVSIGVLFNPYPKLAIPYDINEYVTSIAASSQGRVYALASLNATHDNWDVHRSFEMNRLAQYLQHPQVLGTKLAPANTCLLLTSPIMDDVLQVIGQSDKKLLALHIGTTLFCGPLGAQFGIECCCTPEYVNPALLIPQIERYPDIQFLLLHSGHEFLPADSPFYHNFTFVDQAIQMARQYENVWLSLSAMFANHDDGRLKYPGGVRNLQAMK